MSNRDILYWSVDNKKVSGILFIYDNCSVKVNYCEGSKYYEYRTGCAYIWTGCHVPRGNPYIGPPRPEMKAGGGSA